MTYQKISSEQAAQELNCHAGKVSNEDVSKIAGQSDKAVGIFSKIKVLSKYLVDIKDVMGLISAYATGKYKEVPWRVIAALTGSVAYVFLPVDAIPDILPILGFTDDAAVFGAALSFAGPNLNQYRAWRDARKNGVRAIPAPLQHPQFVQQLTETPSLPIPEPVQIVELTPAETPSVQTSPVSSLLSVSAVGEAILRAAAQLKGVSGVRFGSEMPIENKNNAYHALNVKESVNSILVMIDTSASSNGKEGALYTDEALYVKNLWEKPVRIPLKALLEPIREKDVVSWGECRFTGMTAEISATVLPVLKSISKSLSEIFPKTSAPVSIKDLIETEFAALMSSGTVYSGSEIPVKKRANAFSSMNILEPPSEVYALVDITLFGSGKDGVVMTDKAIYIKDAFESPVRIPWSTITEASSSETTLRVVSTNGAAKVQMTGVSSEGVARIADIIKKAKMIT